MRDKSLGVFLMVIFGVSGAAVLALAWTGTLSGSERIMATLMGLVGLLVAAVQVTLLKSPRDNADNEKVPMKVEVENSR